MPWAQMITFLLCSVWNSCTATATAPPFRCVEVTAGHAHFSPDYGPDYSYYTVRGKPWSYEMIILRAEKPDQPVCVCVCMCMCTCSILTGLGTWLQSGVVGGHSVKWQNSESIVSFR